MEQFHVISILGANARFLDPSTSYEQARRELNRRTFRSHAHHAAAWLLRAGVVLSMFLLGRFVAEGALGSALTGAAALGSVYLLWYACKGHLAIQHDHRAKLYWLQNDAGNEEFSSDDPLFATMPAQEPHAAARHRAS
jgi:hypothetical protein